MRIINKGSITSPIGFLAGAISCGIKKSGNDDLSLLFSERSARCAGVFTTNIYRSGSVILSAERVKKGVAQAVIVNSGNANACVGKKGIEDADKITAFVARELEIDKEDVLIASTGIIGRVLPLAKIERKISPLVKDLERIKGEMFSKAIMTTDTVHKEAAVSIKIGNKPVIIAGAAKGSGMISPHMATMLAFFTTDALIEIDALKAAFKESVDNSFNRITVDGDMSTNDSAIVFANGLSGNRMIKRDCPDYFKFLKALKFVSSQLAQKIVLDGEGATRFVKVLVKGAEDVKSAERIARHVADSNLVKTMIGGGDPNWGRIAASVGSSGINIEKEKIDIYFSNKLVMKHGATTDLPIKELLGVFRRKNIDIIIDIKSGKGCSEIWTCDLTEEYVRINARGHKKG